jgi:beta-lactamase regulating signal transducer with metallopeptidase domain
MNRDFIFWATVESGGLFLAVWLTLKAIPSIPAGWKAWIWRLAFLKALASFLPFAAIPLQVLPAPEEPMPQLPISVHPILYRNGSLRPGAVSQADLPLKEGAGALFTLWALGAGTMLAIGLAGRIRAGSIARKALPEENWAVQANFQELASRAGIVTRTTLVCSSEVAGAMVVGGLQPVIVLPASATEEDAHLMLAHEIAHLARGDLVWFGAIWMIQSLLFFNPFVWLAAHCARRDHESATDRLAIQLAESSVQTYADMLLRTTVVCRVSHVPGALSMATSFRSVHQRLEAMKHFHYQPSLWLKSATLAFAILTIGLLPTYVPAAAQQQAPSDQSHSDSNWISVQREGPPILLDLECKQADVQTALKMVFGRVKVPFEIDPRVKGRVTLRLNNVTVDVAVANIARQAEGTFEVKHGVYRVFPDPNARTFSGTVYMKRQRRGAVDFKPINVTLSFQKTDARQVLRELFKKGQYGFVIDVLVQGDVSISVTDVPFEDALKKVLNQVDSKFVFKDGVYVISRKGSGTP